jgi:hypothetical protein
MMLLTVIFSVVLLHLAAGFGYLIYKLSPTKKIINTHIDDDKTHPVNNF